MATSKKKTSSGVIKDPVTGKSFKKDSSGTYKPYTEPSSSSSSSKSTNSSKSSASTKSSSSSSSSSSSKLSYDQALKNLNAGGLTGSTLKAAQDSLAKSYGVSNTSNASITNPVNTASQSLASSNPNVSGQKIVVRNGVPHVYVQSQTTDSKGNITTTSKLVPQTQVTRQKTIDINGVQVTDLGNGTYKVEGNGSIGIAGTTRNGIFTPNKQSNIDKLDKMFLSENPNAGQQQEQTQQNQELGLPTAALQPGATGSEVLKLQNYLVSKGYLSQADMSTGPGTYGPKTQAAVQKMQGSLAIDNSSGVGYYGPKTIPAAQSGGGQMTQTNQQNQEMGYETLPTEETTTQTSTGGMDINDPYAGIDPLKEVMAQYKSIYKELGLSDIKSQYEDFVKQQEDLTNEQNDEMDNVRANPWYTEGVKERELQNVARKYEQRQNTLVNTISYLDSLYKQGQLQAERLMSDVQTLTSEQRQTAMQIAQTQAEVEGKITNGKTVTTLSGLKTGGTFVSGNLTYSKSDYDGDYDMLVATRGGDGYVDPSLYVRLYQAWLQGGGLKSDFLKVYPIKDYINPAPQGDPNVYAVIKELRGDKIKSTTSSGSSSSGRDA